MSQFAFILSVVVLFYCCSNSENGTYWIYKSTFYGLSGNEVSVVYYEEEGVQDTIIDGLEYFRTGIDTWVKTEGKVTYYELTSDKRMQNMNPFVQCDSIFQRELKSFRDKYYYTQTGVLKCEKKWILTKVGLLRCNIFQFDCVDLDVRKTNSRSVLYYHPDIGRVKEVYFDCHSPERVVQVDELVEYRIGH